MSAYDEENLRQFDLFSSVRYNTSIEKAYYADVHPVSAIDAHSPITFEIKSNTTDYLDLSRTVLYVKLKITQGDGTDLPEHVVVGGDNQVPAVAPENNFMSSIFSNVTLSIAGKCVYNAHHLYGYRSMIESVLFASEREQSNVLVCCGYYEDQNPNTAIAGDFYTNGRDRFVQSRHVELMGRLNIDLFKQNKYLVCGVDMTLELEQVKSTFSLRVGANAVALNPKVSIMDCVLYIRKVTPAPTIFNSHMEGLQTRNLMYPIDRVKVSTFTINAGLTSHSLDNFMSGRLPRLLVVGMVRHDAFNGTRDRCPYNFQHFDLNYLALFKDSEAFPTKPFQPDFEHGLFVREYYTMQSALNSHRIRQGLAPFSVIEPQEFTNGYTLFVFNLQEDNDGAVVKEGNLRLQLGFRVALAQPLNLIVYAMHKSTLEIDSSRQVYMDYTA